jgi:hypothetical protein
MQNPKSTKRVIKSDLKRRMIELCVSIPFGIGFVVLFWYAGLSDALNIFLTVVCWGAVIGIIELFSWLIRRNRKNKNGNKPKKDPFAD